MTTFPVSFILVIFNLVQSRFFAAIKVLFYVTYLYYIIYFAKIFSPLNLLQYLKTYLNILKRVWENNALVLADVIVSSFIIQQNFNKGHPRIAGIPIYRTLLQSQKLALIFCYYLWTTYTSEPLFNEHLRKRVIPGSRGVSYLELL